MILQMLELIISAYFWRVARRDNRVNSTTIRVMSVLGSDENQQNGEKLAFKLLRDSRF